MFQAKGTFATLRNGKFVAGGTAFEIAENEVELFRSAGYSVKEVVATPATPQEPPKGPNSDNINTTPPEGSLGIPENKGVENLVTEGDSGNGIDPSVTEAGSEKAPVLSGGKSEPATPMGKGGTATAKATVTATKGGK